MNSVVSTKTKLAEMWLSLCYIGCWILFHMLDCRNRELIFVPLPILSHTPLATVDRGRKPEKLPFGEKVKFFVSTSCC